MVASCPEHCELFTNTIGKIIAIPCGTTETPLFLSSLATPPDGTFFAHIASAGCTVTFTFYQSENRQVVRSFTPFPGSLSVTLTVPDVERITASCVNGTERGCNIEWEFIYHYCRCCAG